MTDTPKIAIVLFAKQPNVGSNKSRLAESLDWQAATDIYEAMAKDMWNKMIGLGYPIVLSSDTEFSWLPHADHCIKQPEGDFGTRIKYVFEKLHEMGYEGVVSFGADTPHIRFKTMVSAVDHIVGGSELVTWPSDDGGLVLFGMKLPAPVEISDLPFETGKLMNACELVGADILHTRLGPITYDIDTLDDIKRLLSEPESVFEECPLTIAVLRTMTLPD